MFPPWHVRAHVSEADFIRTFRATFGETPNRYLQRRRIERAMFLLRTNDATVTDVCMAVGFSGLAHSAGCSRPASSGSRRASTASAASWHRCRPASPWRGCDPGPTPQDRRRPVPRLTFSIARMLNTISISQIFVPDQDAALRFYVDQLG